MSTDRVAERARLRPLRDQHIADLMHTARELNLHPTRREHEEYTREEWRIAVEVGDTSLGYLHWVTSMLTQ